MSSLLCHGRPAFIWTASAHDPRLLWSDECEDCSIELDAELIIKELAPQSAVRGENG